MEESGRRREVVGMTRGLFVGGKRAPKVANCLCLPQICTLGVLYCWIQHLFWSSFLGSLRLLVILQGLHLLYRVEKL